MRTFRFTIILAALTFAAPAFSQTNPGTSPLSVKKGGTGLAVARVLDFVRDYGGVGDGATANDTQWANFIAAMASTCTPGFVPKGTYVLTTAAVTVAPACSGNFHLYGDGAGSLIKRTSNTTAPAIEVTSGSPIIENLGFQYSNASTAVNGNHEAVRFVGTTNGKMRNITVTGAFYVGLELRNDTGGTLEDNYIQGVINRALFVNTTASGATTKSSVVNNVVDGTNAVGNTNYCINVTVGTTGSTDNISVIGNRVYNCQNQGIAMTAGGGLGNATVSGNNVSDILGSGGIGILVQIDNGVQPLGVAVSGNAVNNVAATGISVSGALFGTIGVNTINNAPTGIQTQISGSTPTNRSVVSGNSIVNAASGIIDLRSSFEVITNNSVQATSVGINIAGSDHCDVAVNNISIGAVGAIGINLAASTTNATACTVRVNEITKLSGSGTIGVQTDAGSSNISGELNTFNGLDTNTSIAGANNNFLIQPADGGIGNAFFQVVGPASSVKTYTFPNSNQTIAALGVSQNFTAQQTFSGPIGVGTTAPGAQVTFTKNVTTTTPPTGTVLEVVGADNSATYANFSGYGAAGTPNFVVRRALGTAASPSPVLAGGQLFAFYAQGYDGVGPWASSFPGFFIEADENFSSGHNGTRLELFTIPDATTTIALSARFNASGGIGVGTTVDPGIGALLTNTSLKSQGATAGLGYAAGAGGAVTQATSRATGVTLNNVTGAITLVSAAGSATPASFTLTDSAIAATDVVKVVQKSGTDLYEIFVTAVAAGSCKITFFTTGGTTTEQPVFNFVIIKGVAS